MPHTPPLYLGCAKMSIAETSLPVQYANWQEQLLLRQRLTTIDNNRKQKLREFYSEQRMVIRNFHAKLIHSRLIQARMSGDRETERAIRSQKSRPIDPVPDSLPQLSSDTSRRATRQGIRRNLSAQPLVSAPIANQKKRNLRPRTVAATYSRTRYAQHNAQRSKEEADISWTQDIPVLRVDGCSLEEGMTTNEGRAESPALILPHDPFAGRIRQFCKSIQHLKNEDGSLHADYYANREISLLSKGVPREAKSAPCVRKSLHTRNIISAK